MRSGDYVEETTTSIASSGAGAVTLTALTNLPRFSTVFGSQNTDVRYIIEDTVNKKFEQGIGRVSANVLTRTKPQVTWDGTTWSPLNPSALTFTGSPTSGDIKIRMAPSSAGLPAAMPAIQSAVAGDAWRDYPISATVVWGGNGSDGSCTVDREVYIPYRLDRGGVLSGIQCQVTILASGKSIKWALYSCGNDGLPGPKIVDFVTISTTTTGAKTDTASASWTPAGKILLTPGWYYIGFISDGTASLNCSSTGTADYHQNPLGRQGGYGYASHIYVAGSYTTGLPAIPSLASGTLLENGLRGTTWMGLQVVS